MASFWLHHWFIFNDIHKPMLGLMGANHNDLIFKTTTITMQDRHLRWLPYFFLGPLVALPLC